MPGIEAVVVAAARSCPGQDSERLKRSKIFGVNRSGDKKPLCRDSKPSTVADVVIGKLPLLRVLKLGRLHYRLTNVAVIVVFREGVQIL